LDQDFPPDVRAAFALLAGWVLPTKSGLAPAREHVADIATGKYKPKIQITVTRQLFGFVYRQNSLRASCACKGML
jgi:hypothetical protein